jgi:hypothetical protein
LTLFARLAATAGYFGDVGVKIRVGIVAVAIDRLLRAWQFVARRIMDNEPKFLL